MSGMYRKKNAENYIRQRNNGFMGGENMRGVKNQNVDIKTDGNDVVVTDGIIEYFRKSKTEQTVAIANDIYFAEKYMEV